MRYVSITDPILDKKIAQDLFDAQGHMVVHEGTLIDDKILYRLQNYGFEGLYIQDEFSDDLYIEDLLTPAIRKEGQEAVRNMDVAACMSVSEKIVHVLDSKKPLHSLDMIDIRSFDDLIYAHTMNVALVSGVIGIAFNLPAQELQNLILAAMLHDFGKMKIPKTILNKPGRLTAEEYNLIKQHPKFSLEIIAEKRQPLPKAVEDAILHHHENYDGSGYPDGLRGEEQSLITRILHVADVYDAMVSRRSFKDAYSIKDTVEYLMGGCGNLFDQAVVEKLTNYVPLYAKGTTVVLTNGLTGIIYENDGAHNMRPVIKLHNGKFLDLTERENFTLNIVQTGEAKAVSIENEKARQSMLQSARKFRLMIVDDMKPNLIMLRGILGDRYDLILKESGQEAIDYFDEKQNIDLLIMDINMPDMNGIETVTKIYEKIGHHIPLLFITELSDRSVLMKCLNLKASGYILRPYKPDFVLSEIERVLG